MLNIDAKYLEHSAGTKFYELVLISDEKAEKFMLIRRFGAIKLRSSGGQVKAQTFSTAHAARAEMVDLLREKESVRKDGRYEEKAFNYGLHHLVTSRVGGHSYPRERVIDEAESHYKNHSSTMREIGEAFSGDTFIALPDELEIVEEGKPEVAPIKRDEDWGSW